MRTSIARTRKNIVILKNVLFTITLLSISFTCLVFYNQYKDWKFENGYFPASYIVGSLFGTFLIPIVIWIILLNEKNELKKIIGRNKIQRKDSILNHPKYGSDFSEKYASLEELKKSQILNDDEFKQKHDDLLKEYHNLIMLEKDITDKDAITKKLKDALEIGNISKEEFNEKLNSFGIYNFEKSTLKLEILTCAVCKEKIDRNDIFCKKCGLKLDTKK